MSRRHLPSKPAKHHTPAEKKHLRALKRRSGPSAVRRRERRAYLQPVEVPEDKQFPKEEQS